MRKRRTSSKIYSITVVIFSVIGLSIGSLFLPSADEQPAVVSEARENLLSVVREHRIAITTTITLADRFHYRNRPLDNKFSSEIFDSYLTALDPQKSYFLQSDIENFSQHRLYFDDYLEEAELDAAFEIFRVFQDRVHERVEYAMELLDYPFDFELAEEFESDRSNADWPNHKEEYDLLWKHIVKDAIITQGLSNPDPAQVLNTLFARYQRIQQTVGLYKAVDVLEIFLNSYLQEMDPYSEYFSPHSSDNLQISISQQIEGIGAMLRNENEATVVHSLITGGPAARSKKLHEGDKIIAVSKGEKKDYIDIVGWRLGDVVDLIRGPKGSIVHLKVIPNGTLPGASPIEIAIVREKIKLEDQVAKSFTFEIDADDRLLQLAVIHLPAFYSELYEDDDAENQRSSSNDVRQILKELTEKNVDGIVLDLRGNGGGRLNEAVELTGLFIEHGPVVQIEDSSGQIEVKSDVDNKVFFDGPLVVLVDRASASASEIFSAAMQDYQRGIIVGETTYGKGMLQTIWPFNDRGKRRNSGAIKLSTARFYRVNGVSPQHLGVTPDVVFETDRFVSNTGERVLENTIPSGTIEPVEYLKPWRDSSLYQLHLPEITRRNAERIKHNPVLRYYVENEKQSRERTERTVVDLNEEKRRATLEQDANDQLKLVNELRSSLGLEQAEQLAGAFPTERAGDAYLDEALNVLADVITLAESETEQYLSHSSKLQIYRGFSEDDHGSLKLD